MTINPKALHGLVMPLKWFLRGYGFHAAESQVGMYYTTEYAGMSHPFKLDCVGRNSAEMFDTIEAAKTAAQADYAARIIAALNPDAVAAMLAEAEQRGRDEERERAKSLVWTLGHEIRSAMLVDEGNEQAVLDMVKATADAIRAGKGGE